MLFRSLDRWKAKAVEVIDKYRPDLLWFDAGLKFVQEKYKKDVVAYYYNQAEEWGKEVALTYKWNDLVPGCGVVDLELGRFDTLTYRQRGVATYQARARSRRPHCRRLEESRNR